MTARTGMGDLIGKLRGMTNAGTADWTLGTATFWDDNHIQEVLDMHRVDVYRERLTKLAKHTGGGSIEYLEYRSRYAHWEGGTAVFTLEDSTGADVGTASFAADYSRGIITFGSDTSGSTYFASGRVYDPNAAAADIWEQKAAHFSEHYSFSADGQRLSRDQIIEHCLRMADKYDRKSEPSVTTLTS